MCELAKIVFVGEVHDIADHHRDELAVIRALHKAGTPLAVGIEMFRSENNKVLAQWIDGSLKTHDFLPAYYDNWSEPWPLYRDIFEYLRQYRIPVIGLNIPDDIADAIARRGFASLNARQKSQLPQGISCNVDPTYMEFIRKAYAGHSPKSDKTFLNFCEAQMVWDKTMAWHIMEYLEKNPGRTMVVLAGIGHAWKRGIPEQLAGLSRYPYKVASSSHSRSDRTGNGYGPRHGLCLHGLDRLRFCIARIPGTSHGVRLLR